MTYEDKAPYASTPACTRYAFCMSRTLQPHLITTPPKHTNKQEKDIAENCTLNRFWEI